MLATILSRKNWTFAQWAALDNSEKDYWFAWEEFQQDRLDKLGASIVHEKDGEQITDIGAYVHIILAKWGLSG